MSPRTADVTLNTSDLEHTASSTTQTLAILILNYSHQLQALKATKDLQIYSFIFLPINHHHKHVRHQPVAAAQPRRRARPIRQGPGRGKQAYARAPLSQPLLRLRQVR